MNNIKFSHNWNDKLNHQVFTTIRKYSQGKYEYYDSLLFQDFNIILNNQQYGIAKLIDVDDNWLYKEIPKGFLCVDTGLFPYKEINNFEEIDRLFKQFGIDYNDRIMILTFKKL